MTAAINGLSQPLTMANGRVLKNRIAKSAMSEALGTTDNRMTPELIRLYEQWADGGASLLITGNVMVDRRALGEPNNLAVEDERDLEMLVAWAQAGTRNGTELWAQLNHPGKQCPKGLNEATVAPSAIGFGADMNAFFAMPRELSDSEIRDIIQRFASTSRILKKAGFTGVQIHGAHGYLVSQFLSPRHNQRTDEWGGSPENRRRFVLELYRAIRTEVGSDYPVSIKLNSADFQRGGFTEEESLDVIRALASEGIDLIEISGGTYEAPVMAGGEGEVKNSTRQREAYFLAFAEKARAAVATPLMVTGGFRTYNGMSEALGSNAFDIVGIGRAFAVEPNLPERLLAGQDPQYPVKPISTGIAMVDKMAMMEVVWYGRQLRRMGQGKSPKPNESGFLSLLASLGETGIKTFKTRRLRANN